MHYKELKVACTVVVKTHAARRNCNCRLLTRNLVGNVLHEPVGPFGVGTLWYLPLSSLLRRLGTGRGKRIDIDGVSKYVTRKINMTVMTRARQESGEVREASPGEMGLDCERRPATVLT